MRRRGERRRTPLKRRSGRKRQKKEREVEKILNFYMIHVPHNYHECDTPFYQLSSKTYDKINLSVTAKEDKLFKTANL